jgi:hypothetical protein
MPYIEISIPVSGGEFAHPDELDMRWDLEDAILEQAIGEISGSGTGFGTMDLEVRVKDVEWAMPRIEALLKQFNVSSAQFKVYAEDDDGEG